jgi:hypothetical protein
MMTLDVGWTALQWRGMEHVIVSADERGSRADGDWSWRIRGWPGTDWPASGSRTGMSHDLDVAYVSLPELSVRPTRQRYTLLSRDERNHTLFRYVSRSLVADLDVDGEGFVVDYPGIWRRITAGPGAGT